MEKEEQLFKREQSQQRVKNSKLCNKLELDIYDAMLQMTDNQKVIDKLGQ